MDAPSSSTSPPQQPRGARRALMIKTSALLAGAASAASGVIALLAGLGVIVVPRLVVGLLVASLFGATAYGTVRTGLWASQLVRFRAGGPYRYPPGPVAGYPGRLSCFAGEAVDLYIHGRSEVRGDLFRLGANKEAVRSLPLAAVPQSDVYHRRTGAGWQRTGQFESDGLRPGLYGLEMTAADQPGQRFALPLIIKPTEPSRIAVIAGTNTWEAYNAWGGLSNYRNDHMARWLFLARRQVRALPRPLWNTLPFHRPNKPVSDGLLALIHPDANHGERLIATEWSLLAFLEREGFDYGVYSDVDLAFSDEPLEADLLIIHGHTEYWAAEMVHAVERYVQAGGRLLVSGGNPLYSVVEFTAEGLLVDPVPAPRSGVTRLIGSYYTDAGQHTAAPMKVMAPGHWVFAGLGVERDQVFGRSSCYRPHGGRQTRQAASDLGEDGASGVFTQETGIGGGAFEMLAVGLNPHGPAHVMFRATAEGGWVFNSSSGAFTGAVMRDPVVAGMLRNLVRNAMEHASPRSGGMVAAAD